MRDGRSFTYLPRRLSRASSRAAVQTGTRCSAGTSPRVPIRTPAVDAAVAAGATAPLGRFATAEEVAAATMFLMTNPYITGSVIAIDDGQALA